MNMAYMRNLSIGGIIDYTLQAQEKVIKKNDPHQRVMMHRVYTLDEVDAENVVNSKRVIAKYGKGVVFYCEYKQCFPKKSELAALTPTKMMGVTHHHMFRGHLTPAKKEKPVEIEVYEIRGKKWITHELLKRLESR